MLKKGLITIAVGKKYVLQAKYLAYSCLLNAPHILRSVITDNPEFLTPFYDIVIPFNREYEDVFSLKTRLYLYTPFEKTLYLDADSLIINAIDSYWNALDDQAFAYEGALFDQGDWYFNIETVIKQLNIPWLPKFNSGMFLFDKSKKAKDIFDTAYYYFMNNKKENLNIPFFRENMYPDEPFFAISFSKNDVKPVKDYGRFSRTLIDAKKIRINVVKRIACFTKQGVILTPFIVHFCGRFGGVFYFFEKLRLFLCFNNPFQALISGVLDTVRNLSKRDL
jgi:hypothetical protein